MPQYEYECPACQHTLTDIFKFSDPIPDCPQCKAGPMKRLIGAGAFRLRGPGWTGSVYSRYRKET